MRALSTRCPHAVHTLSKRVSTHSPYTLYMCVDMPHPGRDGTCA
jgi:hypothetical protein